MSDVMTVWVNSSTMAEVVYKGVDGRQYKFAEVVLGSTTWGNVAVSAGRVLF